MRPLGAGAIVVEREEQRRGCGWNGGEVVVAVVVRRDRDARSWCCAQPDLAVPVARAARQFPGQRGQVSHLLRHPGRHDLRGVSGQTVLERRTTRGVSRVLFSLFSPPSSSPLAFQLSSNFDGGALRTARADFRILGKVVRHFSKRQKCSRILT